MGIHKCAAAVAAPPVPPVSVAAVGYGGDDGGGGGVALGHWARRQSVVAIWSSGRSPVHRRESRSGTADTRSR